MAMKLRCELVEDLISNPEIDCPLPLEVIPNNMGINLCAVHSVQWMEREDGQLEWLMVAFIPSDEEGREKSKGWDD